MHTNLFNPSYLKKLCEQCGLRPSKRYGQNFLISEKPIRKMIEAAELKKTDTVVEIGPGFGVLTLAIAPLVDRAIAFEIEKRLEGYWKEKLLTQLPALAGNKEIRNKKRCSEMSSEGRISRYGEIRNKEIRGNNIEIIWGNALKNIQYSISNIQYPYKVLANLPYQITSHVLRTLLELENKPEQIIVMVQKEVAERICAKPGEMSLLAVSAQYYGEPKIICRVSKGSFWPEPRVDSAVVMIDLRGKGKGERGKQFDNEFFRVVKIGFANKRKQLWRNLSAGLKLEGDKVKEVLRDVCGNEKVRAGELGVEEWKRVVEMTSDL